MRLIERCGEGVGHETDREGVGRKWAMRLIERVWGGSGP